MCHYFLWGLSSCISVSVWILVRLKPQTPDESVIMHSVSVVNFTVILSPLFFFAAMLLFDSLTGCDKRSGTRHVVVSRYSSSSVSRSQQQSVSHSVGGGGVCGSREDEKKKERKKKRATERRIFTTQTVARVSCIPMSVPLLPGSITLRRVGICLRGHLQVLQVSRSPGVCVSEHYK